VSHDLATPDLAAGELAAAELAALGTTARVVVTDDRGLDTARTVLADVLADIDRACSRFRDDSELAAVNRAGGGPVAVSALFLEALEIALRAARLTGGLVDPTVGAALRVLGYDRDFGAVAPDGDARRPVVARIPGWRAVRVDPIARTVRIPAGAELDLGATAKGFAADRAAATVRAAVGRGGVLVSLGGDIAVAGPAPRGGWPVLVTDDHAALAHPSTGAADSELVAITAGGLATSSTTVRRWRRGDEELHHIVDPSRGTPADVVWRTVSVAAATCADANAASTAAIVRGRDAPDWLERNGLPARLVRPDGDVVRVGAWPSVIDSGT